MKYCNKNDLLEIVSVMFLLFFFIVSSSFFADIFFLVYDSEKFSFYGIVTVVNDELYKYLCSLLIYSLTLMYMRFCQSIWLLNIKLSTNTYLQTLHILALRQCLRCTLQHFLLFHDVSFRILSVDQVELGKNRRKYFW